LRSVNTTGVVGIEKRLIRAEESALLRGEQRVGVGVRNQHRARLLAETRRVDRFRRLLEGVLLS
jgi:hypothetical protein